MTKDREIILHEQKVCAVFLVDMVRGFTLDDIDIEIDFDWRFALGSNKLDGREDRQFDGERQIDAVLLANGSSLLQMDQGDVSMIRSTTIVGLRPAYLEDGWADRELNVDILTVAHAEDVNIVPFVILSGGVRI